MASLEEATSPRLPVGEASITPADNVGLSRHIRSSP
jgi:hypothetical protein